MRRAAVIAASVTVLAAACVTPAPPVVELRDTSAAPTKSPGSLGKGKVRPGSATDDRRFENPSGADIAKILDESGLRYETVEPGRRWMIAFAGEHLPRVVLYVIHGREFTIVLGKLFTVADSTGPAFYRALARKNYDFDQLKLSVDKGGGVFASFEVPTRIVDKRELLENIFGLASAIDDVLPELVKLADPVAPKDSDDADDVPPAELPKLPKPLGDGPVIEARADGVRR